MITIISDEEQDHIGRQLYHQLKNGGADAVYVAVPEMDIKPCYSCDGCVKKVYGKCVVRDDMDQILPVIANADDWVYVTGITWGGPSYIIKKVLDKSALLGNPFYKVRKGELVKGTRVHARTLTFIGITEAPQGKQTEDFEFWAKEVGNIMDLNSKTLIIRDNRKAEKGEAEIEKNLEKTARNQEETAKITAELEKLAKELMHL